MLYNNDFTANVAIDSAEHKRNLPAQPSSHVLANSQQGPSRVASREGTESWCNARRRLLDMSFAVEYRDDREAPPQLRDGISA